MCRARIPLVESQLWAVAYQCASGQGETRHGPRGPTLAVPSAATGPHGCRGDEFSAQPCRKGDGEETVGRVGLANQGSSRQKFYLFMRNFVVGRLLLFPATDVMSTPQSGHVPQCLGDTEYTYVSLRDMENVATRVKVELNRTQVGREQCVKELINLINLIN
jgi:hypothetical protein